MKRLHLLIRREAWAVLAPSLLLMAFSIYSLYVQRLSSTLEGKWLEIKNSGYVASGERYVISFDRNGLCQVESKGGVSSGVTLNFKTQSHYRVRFGRIDFYDEEILETDPSIEWPYGTPDHSVYIHIDNQDRISLTSPPTKLKAVAGCGGFACADMTFEASTSQWQRIKSR